MTPTSERVGPRIIVRRGKGRGAPQPPSEDVTSKQQDGHTKADFLRDLDRVTDRSQKRA